MFKITPNTTATIATTAPPEYPPPPSIAHDLGLNTPADFGIIGVMAYAIWKQHEVLGILKHTDELQQKTLESLRNTLKILRNIVDKHERRLDRLEGKNPERRQLSKMELDTYTDESD